MTHNVTSPPSIDALRKAHSYHLVGDGQKARQEHRACQKAPFKLAPAGINCACLEIPEAQATGPRCSRLRTGSKQLGMSEYAQRFAENDIDIAVLPHLTDQHLKDLVSRLGIA